MKFVYVMKSNGAYKIGVSQNPKKRLFDLGIGNCNIELIYESKELENAYSVERAAHKQFCNYAVGREWFSVCDESELIDAVRTLVDKIGVCTVDAELKSLDKGGQVEGLIDWALYPQKREFEELCEEVDKIAEENRNLAERLIQLGWTQGEVKNLIDSATESARR